MQRHKPKNNGGESRGFKKTDILAPERTDLSRLYIIFANGFGVAEGYSHVNRDRYMVQLQDGKTFQNLLEFCRKELNGEKMPGADPISDGPRLLRLFKAAESAGLVIIEFVQAGRFLPEKA